ncbi:MAG: hypothetical protein V1773_00830 [bacterium]
MKKLFYFFCLTFVISSSVYSQIHSVDVYGEYSSPLTKRINVTDIDGVGAGAKIRIKIYDNVSLNVYGGYTLYSLSQENGLATWNWQFWGRYNDFIQQTLSDEAYKSFLSPVQKMDLLQLSFTFDYDFTVIEKLHVKPALGAGVYFYTRRLYIDETWSKYFSAIDYTFEYSFRNIAPEKFGNPLFYTAGIDLNYELMENFWINGSAKYVNVFDSDYSYGFDLFPFKEALNLNLGLTILY